ncbi:hypothetical protein [Herbidospora cretacea]|uniref:hypothetical protein n=1 Tax=Herbidospora cretacea TaxID=28444 RepID=UPI000AF1EA85|nr:hypothetical protein [Herbidospora cretacea]
MKRLLSTAVAVTVMVSTTAFTTPPDALRAQFVAGRGVTMTTTYTDAHDGSSFGENYRVEFGPGGVVAVDKRDRPHAEYPSPPPRWLTFKGRSYCQGWICPTPPTKSWVRYDFPGDIPRLSSGEIPLDEPATLKALLARASGKGQGGVYDGTRTTIHRGVITYGDLFRLSPGVRHSWGGDRPDAKTAKEKIVWRLWIGKDGLVRRVWTSTSEDRETWVFTRVTDSLLRGWGAKTHIQEPSASDSATDDEWHNS